MRLLAPHWRFWALLLVLLAGCTLNNASTTNPAISGAPVVKIGAPSPNATYLEGVVVNIQATISNAGQDIDRVEIVIDGSTAATLNTPNAEGTATFNVTHGWSASGVGTHSISIVAYRADGSSSTPDTVAISVIAQNSQPQTNPSPTPSGQNPLSAATATLSSQSSQPTNPPPATQSQPTNPPASATPSTPTASFTQGVNVRRGPGLEFDPPIGAFAAGQTTDILAVNPAGTWYKVRYGGGEGWVFAALTNAAGDIASLTRDPGPPVPTAAPPTAVPPTQPPPLPATTANLVAGIVELNPGTPTCNQTFNIGLDVANLGGEPTASSGTVSVQDVRSSDGSVQETTIGGYPVLQPQQTFRVDMPLTVSTWYGQEHTIILIIDPDNQIPETNEGDNRREVKYTLQQGSCP
jgi:Bacterial SH3 domain/CARDB/Bacterial Ig domain